jgi:hypothetical protein
MKITANARNLYLGLMTIMDEALEAAGDKIHNEAKHKMKYKLCLKRITKT